MPKAKPINPSKKQLSNETSAPKKPLYSSKDILKLRVDKNETVSNFVKTIKKSNVGLDNTKFLKVDLSSDELSDRLALLEADPFTNIKKTLNGEELNANKTTILEYFDTG
ncbi:11611_t:CDS:2, partial [Rhizophagus irregularis]